MAIWRNARPYPPVCDNVESPSGSVPGVIPPLQQRMPGYESICWVRLLAVDDSDVNIAKNPDSDTYMGNGDRAALTSSM